VRAGAEALARLRELVFDLVPTLGMRETPTKKHMLDRSWVEVVVDGRPVRIKLGHRNGRIITATPEFSDVAAVAEASGATER
jgi:hypothetical protein